MAYRTSLVDWRPRQVTDAHPLQAIERRAVTRVTRLTARTRSVASQLAPGSRLDADQSPPLGKLRDGRLAGVEAASQAFDRVIAHVPDANRRLLQLAVTAPDREAAHLHRLGHFRTLDTGRKRDHGHGRRPRTFWRDDVEVDCAAHGDRFHPGDRRVAHGQVALPPALDPFAADVAHLRLERVE